MVRHTSRRALYAGGLVCLLALQACGGNMPWPANSQFGLSLVSVQVSEKPVGTPVSFAVLGGESRPLLYRFRVVPPRNSPEVFHDFGPLNTITFTALTEGVCTIEATVKMGDASEIRLTGNFTFVSRADGDAPVVSSTSHPLVALYSAPPCQLGSTLTVRSRPVGSSDEAWSTTTPRNCLQGKSVNVYVAGMAADTAYELEGITSGTRATRPADSPLTFQTGTPDVPLPAFSVVRPPDRRTCTAEGVVLHSATVELLDNGETALVPLPVATTLDGAVVWYYRGGRGRVGEFSVLTTHTGQGTLLLLVADEAGLKGQYLREVDVAGHVIRETNVARVNEQLADLGLTDGIGAFDHEAIRFPDGNTLVQASVERIMEVGTGQDRAERDVLGEMLIALDPDWQVAWTWNAFDHLDVDRTTMPGAECLSNASGCPPLFLADAALDWTHGNAIAPSPLDGNLVHSLRHQNWVIKVDYRNGRGTGEVLWRLGKEGDFYAVAATLFPWFSGQHGANYFADHRITLLDNGNNRCEHRLGTCNSRGQVWFLDETPPRRAILLQNIDLGVYSLALGMAQRLENGNLQFTCGALHSGNDLFARSMETSGGNLNYTLQSAPGSEYRSYRLSRLN